MLSAALHPSMAADMMPPAYPGPSPQGYRPFILLIMFSSLIIFTGEEVLASTAERMASSLAYPSIFRSNASIPSISASFSSSGRIPRRFVKVVSPL